MKILYITNFRIPTNKAHGYQICKMCEEFTKNGADVELLIPNKNKNQEDLFKYYEIEKNFQVKIIKVFDAIFRYKFLGKLRYFLYDLIYLLYLLKEKINKNSIIYTRNPEIAWFFKIRGYKTIFEAHSWPNSKNLLYKFLLKKVDLIICNSHGTEKIYKINNFKKIITAPNGVDLDKFKIKKDKKELKQELEIPQDKNIIMYAGHLYEWKGIDIIIKIASELREDKNIFFIIIGGLNSDVYKYKKICEVKKINNIKFLGYKNKKDIPSYLKTADILLLPNHPSTVESVKFTSPIKMFEYMASNVPIVASDLPSIKEILNNNNSILVDPSNSNIFIKAINKILNNKEFAKNIANVACEDVKNYTWEKRAIKILQKLNDIKQV
ncbi:MAG: glycosyltransferase family 4 protein [Candidatus Falkowbacteria bacterium]